jgi:glutathione S-transferase
MAMLEGRLAVTQAYVAGPDFSIADIALGLSAHRWFCTPTGQADLPHCRAFYERVKARPAAARYLTAEMA